MRPIYTPLKRRSSFATVVGAIPGALPPVIGWAAASDQLSRGAWVLFGIVFLWQLPHFLAIAWIYRDDYARAGLPDAAGDRARWPEHRHSRRRSTARRCCRSAWCRHVGLTDTAYFAAALCSRCSFSA